MPILSHKSSSKKRLFTNYPLRRGMYYGNLITSEGTCKSSVNLDATSSGEEGYPRPSFINAVMHNGSNNVSMPTAIIRQSTNKGPRFLIGANATVGKDLYVSEEVGDATANPSVPYKSLYNINIVRVGSDVTQLSNDTSLVKVILDSVIDGDTIECHYADIALDQTPFRVRPLLINTEETTGTTYIGEYNDTVTYQPGHVVTSSSLESGYRCLIAHSNEPLTDITYWEPFQGHYARLQLGNLIENFDDMYLQYDEFSEKVDNEEFNRDLAHILVTNDIEVSHILVSAHMLIYGYAELAFVSENYKYYDDVIAANAYAVANNLGVHGPSVPGDLSTEYTAYVIQDGPITVDMSSGLIYYKQEVSDNCAISETIYGTKGFFEATPVAFDFGTTLDEDITIEFLVHEEISQEYEYKEYSKNIPYVNMPWKNSIGVFGRVIEDGIVRYKGLISFQYGRIDEADPLQHFIILQEAYEVDLATFSDIDAYSIQYNCLDDDPYIFEDYIGEDADTWLRPIVLGTVLYSDNNLDSKTKVMKAVSPGKAFTVKPYYAIPEITVTGFEGIDIRFLIGGKPEILTGSDDDGWLEIVDSSNVYTDPIAKLHRIWNVQGNGGSISTELRTRLDGWSHGNISIDYNTAGNGFPADFNQVDPLLDKVHETEYSLKVGHTLVTSVNGTTIINRDRITATLTNTVTEEFTTVDFDGTVTSGGPPPTAFHVKFAVDDVLAIAFENIKATFTINDVDDLPTFKVRSTVTCQYEHWTSVGASQLLRMSTEESVIDPNKMLADHNVWDATEIAILDRFLVFYGSEMGNHSLQFSEFDRQDFLPFPYGQITFDSEIIHVHPHMGMLYVFCSDGLWILHSGFSYKDMVKTFAYSGSTLNPADKKTVVSMGNEVFFMSGGKGYVIRANQYVQTKEDVYVMQITQSVNELLNTPHKFVQERLQNAYGILVEDLTGLSVSYICKVVKSELHIIASYHFQDPIDVLMVTYIYNKDNKSWRLYDTVAGSFPIEAISSSSLKGYDLLLLNRYQDGFVTYGSYVYSLPDTTGIEQDLGDARCVIFADGAWELADADHGVPKSLLPIQTMIDSGALELSGLHKKRVRQITFKFSNPNAEEFFYRLIPFMDGIPQHNVVSVNAILNESGEMIDTLLQEVDLGDTDEEDVVLVFIKDTESMSLINTKFTTLTKFEVVLDTNMIGSAPGFQLYIPAKYSFYINQYGVRYRQFGTR